MPAYHSRWGFKRIKGGNYEPLGCQVGNANVNELNLRTLRQERRFELILFLCYCGMNQTTR
jgi:hypothetical protein